MPSNADIQTIYNLERVVELAFQQLFVAAQIPAYAGSLLVPSTGDAQGDADLTAQGYNVIDFQRARPRVEIFATIGAGKGQFIAHPQYSGVECETAWDVNVSLFLITQADMILHSSLRSQTRYLLHSARGTINNLAPLTNHYLATIADAGTSPVEQPEDGVFQTRINFSSMISVQNNAWSLLAT